MASYHCSVKVGGKGKASAHSAYIAREGKYADLSKNRPDSFERIEATGTGNMPAWAESDPARFWEAADQYERANGATYREVEVALPRELTPEQRKALVEDFIAKEIGDKHAYQYAIHTPKAALDKDKGEQPHAHIMYSERTVDGIDRDPDQYFKRYNAKHPENGGCRKDSAGTEERLLATRERWAEVQNRHLERAGHEVRVDHRSLEDQGIEREPERHLGPIGVRQLAQDDAAYLRELREAEGEKTKAEREAAIAIADMKEAGERELEEKARADRELYEQAKADVALAPPVHVRYAVGDTPTISAPKSEAAPAEVSQEVRQPSAVDQWMAERQKTNALLVAQGEKVQEWRHIKPGEQVSGPVQGTREIDGKHYLVIDAGPNRDMSGRQYVVVEDVREKGQRAVQKGDRYKGREVEGRVVRDKSMGKERGGMER